ncbi:hypothetical protein EJ04DRAFT_451398, partial [Polyplosphaeria fusca]
EWAVRIDICATASGGSRLCGHVFGRRCLEHHLKSNRAWSNTCPLCRAKWYEPAQARDTDPSVAADPWIAREVVDSDESAATNRGPDNELSPRGRLQRSAGFLRQVLEAFDVEEGSDQVRYSVEEVERSLERLYRNLEGRSD